MDFAVDPNAPVLEENCELLDAGDVAGIIEGAHLICESIQDNDIERWSLTRAGQFVRETGEDGGRFYVFPQQEAMALLADLADDKTMESLHELIQVRPPKP